MDQDIKTLLNHRRLRHIQRSNNFPKVMPEDVAAHSFFVAELVMVIGTQVNELNPGAINMEVALRKAICHDLGEAYTSDIPWNIKHATPELNKAINDAVDDRMATAYSGCGPAMMETKYCAGQCKAGIEGSLVALADMLELGLWCWEEVTAGNKFMADLMGKAVDLCEGYLEKFDTLSDSQIARDTLEMLTEAWKEIPGPGPIDID